MESIYYHYIAAPIGDFLVAGTDSALILTSFTSGHQQRKPSPDWKADPAPLGYALPSFYAYFDAEVVEFDIPLTTSGSEFQCAVWDCLRRIPFGETRSYGQIAEQMGKPGASRAVGTANAANHLPIVIPCHRVIGSDGSLTGFGGGLNTKKLLLELEGIQLPHKSAQLELI